MAAKFDKRVLRSWFYVTSALALGAATVWHRQEEQPQKYHPTKDIRRMKWDERVPFAKQLANRGEPVVLTGTMIDKWPARKRWTSASEIARLFPKTLQGVFHHSSGQGSRFGPFYDPQRPFNALSTVKPHSPYENNATLSRSEFLALFAGRGKARPGCFAYSGNVVDALGEEAEDELDPLDELLVLNPSHSSVNLWIGQPGATTPCHYDGYSNFYVQLSGFKRFVLFAPSEHRALHTFPFLHPSFAQCQATLPNIDRLLPEQRFHNQLAGLEIPADDSLSPALVADLGPGDLLFLPPFWLHEVISISPPSEIFDANGKGCGTSGASISVNVWTGLSDSHVIGRLFSKPLPGVLSSDVPLKISWPRAQYVSMVNAQGG